jgi:hypothetical protein
MTLQNNDINIWSKGNIELECKLDGMTHAFVDFTDVMVTSFELRKKRELKLE